MPITARRRHQFLIQELENDRQSWEPHWQDLATFFRPNRERFWVDENNRGDRKNTSIIDNSGVLALRTLRSGLMAGLTSPARPWFRLSTADRELSEFGPVKEWLEAVRRIMLANIARTNAYKVFSQIYGDNGCFGTACMLMEENLDRTFHTYGFPIGEYYIANDDFGRVRIFARRFRMTVRQAVMKFVWDGATNTFDWTNASRQLRDWWNDERHGQVVNVWHIVEPNPDFNPRSFASRHKRFLSSYYEDGRVGSRMGDNYLDRGTDDQKYLRQRGYDEFPVLAPRWDLTEGDNYGTGCPGMDSLGDNKQLQTMEKVGAQGLQKMVRPAMKAPTSLMRGAPSIVSGAITYVDEGNNRTSFSPVHEIRNFPLDALENKEQQIRQRVSMAHYEPLFLMLAQSDRRQITAREIEERHEEKLIALGPVLEQMNWDLLDPFIDLAFMYHSRQQLLPPAPQELVGQPLKVVYESILAQAQKLAGVAGIERFAGFVVQAAGVDNAVLDKIKTDQLIDVYADALSVPPSIVRDDIQVAEIRAARQAEIQRQQQLEGVERGARAAKDLAGVDTQGDNALTQLMRAARAGQVA